MRVVSPAVQHEIARDNHLSIRLLTDGVDGAVRDRAYDESRVERTVRFEASHTACIQAVELSESSGHVCCATGQREYGMDRGISAQAGIKGSINAAIQTKLGETSDRHTEPAADEHTSISLDRQDSDRSIEIWNFVEIRIGQTVGQEAGDPAISGAVDIRERATDDHAAIRNHSDR